MPETDQGPAVQGRLPWLTAEVRALIEETPRVRSLELSVPRWREHLPGQHVDVRLTGEDGYLAQRRYSIESAPGDPRLILTIARIDEGTVYSYHSTQCAHSDPYRYRVPHRCP